MSDSTSNSSIPPETPEISGHPESPGQNPETAGTRHRVVLHRDGERWEFGWDGGDARGLIQVVSELPGQPGEVARRGPLREEREIGFDWFDAAVVCRQIAQEAGLSPPGGEESERQKS